MRNAHEPLIPDAARNVAARPRKALALALALACNTATASVTTCADDGPGSLRNAVLVANAGDTIDLATLPCSRITLTSGAIYVGLDDLTINGPGAASLVIDGNKNGRVFLHGGAGTLTVSNVTVANGKIAAASAFGAASTAPGTSPWIRRPSADAWRPGRRSRRAAAFSRRAI